MKDKELKGYVGGDDRNHDKIVKVNVFELNGVANANLYRYNLHKETNKKKFEKNLKAALMSEFWCRSEYETIITSGPPYMFVEDLHKLVKDVEESDYPIRMVNPPLDCSVKIDIFDQLELNGDKFVDYVGKNRELIKKYKHNYIQDRNTKKELIKFYKRLRNNE